jgi:uncharacterized protein (DUF1330 family)
MKEVLCPHCGKTFFTYYNKFCSRRCGVLSHPAPNKGKKIPNMTGPKNHNWKGGRRKHSAGYIEIRDRNYPGSQKYCGYVLEHRLVVEKQIGRFLRRGESVHHLGEKDDNRPNRLMAFAGEKYHQLFENGKPVPEEKIIFDGRKL